MSLIWKLLRQNISISQLIGFFVSNLVGTVVVLLTIQLYADIRPLFSSSESFMKSDYMVVSKKLSSVTSLLGKNMAFNTKNIEELEQQTFAKSVAAFSSSQFEVYVSLEMPQTGQRVSSDIFFESVPDSYIDVDTDKWYYDTEEGVIPIIMPRNYLNLYNFGFSQSRNLPQLSEGAISLIVLDVYIRGVVGNGRPEKFKANIVGFSDKLNTILVPQTFMDWANQRYVGETNFAPTRLILEVNNPSDDAIVKFLEERKYVVENDKLDGGKISHLMRVAIYGVLAIGAFISLLSLYILMLSIFLLLEKNSSKLKNLHLIGYSREQITAPYKILTASLNLLIFLVSIAVVASIRHCYMPIFEDLLPYAESSSLLPTVGVAFVIMVVVTAFNCLIIGRKSREL